MSDVRDFYYDEQIRRFIVQFIRMMSGFQVMFGEDTLIQVPIVYGDPSRQAAAILSGNSENMLNTVPMMSAYVEGLEYRRTDVQDPLFVDKRHVRMRKRDADSGELTTEQGNAFTIERLMPVPYTMKMKLDMWTSNTTQKLQLFEQIAPLFNPSFEIQSTDNYFDWTSLSVVKLITTVWDSRSIPVGQENPISVMTFSFEIPIWISPPAKVMKLGMIDRVVMGIYDGQGDLESSVINNDLLMGERLRFTPLGYDILLLNNELTVHRSAEFVHPDNDDIGVPEVIGTDPKITWDEVFTAYGKRCEGITEINLLMDDDITEISGTITSDPEDNNKLFYMIDIDTIPSNDLNPITAVIDPLRSGPGAGLVDAAVGQRYLFIQDIGYADDSGAASAWEGTANNELIAKTNDIVEYDGATWSVVFDADAMYDTIHYTTNLTTSIQYQWNKTHWRKSYEGEYVAGRWRIVL